MTFFLSFLFFSLSLPAAPASSGHNKVRLALTGAPAEM